MCVRKKYIYISKYDNNYIELHKKIINKKNQKKQRTCLGLDYSENFVHHLTRKLNALKYHKLQF